MDICTGVGVPLAGPLYVNKALVFDVYIGVTVGVAVGVGVDVSVGVGVGVGGGVLLVIRINTPA